MTTEFIASTIQSATDSSIHMLLGLLRRMQAPWIASVKQSAANSNRAEYLQQARALLGLAKDEVESLADEPESAEWNPATNDGEEPSDVEFDSSVPRCPNCGQAMVKVDFERRPSWRITMNGPYRPSWYNT